LTAGAPVVLHKKTGDADIKIENGLCLPDRQRQQEKNAMILKGIVAFFIRQILWYFSFVF